MTVDHVRARLDALNERIDAAARRSGRKREDVLLVGVSKTVCSDRLKLAFECGLRDFGENRIQEYLAKRGRGIQEARWHIIGRLQTNKMKHIAGQVCLIHSVDSARIAAEIDRQAAKTGRVQDILIQVNIGKEETKGGVTPEKLEDLCRITAPFSHLKVRGLMAIPPMSGAPRRYFAAMRQLFIDIRSKKIDNICMDYLSMGMSGDFETAVEEGANIVRIGAALFGERKKRSEINGYDE